MKKEIIILSVFMATLLITACRKEKTEQTSASGYWFGVVTGNEMAVLNKENGTARLYVFPVNVNGRDTATDAVKYDGTWQVSGNIYSSIYNLPGNATYIFRATVKAPVISITGVLNTVSPNNSGAAVFYMIKK